MGGYGRRLWARKDQPYLSHFVRLLFVYCSFFGLFELTRVGGGRLIIRQVCGEIVIYVQADRAAVARKFIPFSKRTCGRLDQIRYGKKIIAIRKRYPRHFHRQNQYPNSSVK